MIKAIIIDDEPSCIESLQYDLKNNCPEVQVIQTCQSSKEGIMAIRTCQPQLVFLDVQMPWMNGFEMLELIGQIDFAIIFTTAFDQFAARAFRISAVDYLLKPVDTSDLKTAVKKVVEKIAQQTGSANINNMLQNIRKPESHQRIAFPARDGYEFVEIENIVYVCAEGAYSHVFLKDKRKLVISKTLSDIAEMLPDAFFQRIHHSTLVNTQHVTHFLRTDGGYVIMDTGEKLVVSKSKKEEVMLKLGVKKD
jgi:two-component system LytT family response regulator